MTADSSSLMIVSYSYLQGTGWGAAISGERMRKFARHLPEHGFRVRILTHHGGPSGPLERDLHAARDISRTLIEPRLSPSNLNRPVEGWQASTARSWARRWVLPDRPSYTWVPFAITEGMRMAADEMPRVLLSSSPRVANHLVAYALSRRLRIPWIADVRDGYSFQPPEGEAPLRTARRVIEKLGYRKASRIVTVTDALRDNFCELLPERADDVVTISNGYDEALFPEGRPVKPAAAWRILYAGSTGFRLGQRLSALAEAVDQFGTSCPRTVELVIAGILAPQELERCAVHRRVNYIGWQDREAIAGRMREADVLVVLTGNHTTVATTKLFEYIGAARPVLVVGRQSAAARIVAEGGFGIAVDDDAAEISRALAAIYRERAQWEARLRSGKTASKRASFSRAAKAKALAELMAEVIAEGPR